MTATNNFPVQQTVIKPGKSFKIAFILFFLLFLLALAAAIFNEYRIYQLNNHISVLSSKVADAEKKETEAMNKLNDKSLSYEDLEADSKNYILLMGGDCSEDETATSCLRRLTGKIKANLCSGNANSICPAGCGSDEDADCCVADANHYWFEGKCLDLSVLENCSIVKTDNSCPDICSIQNDADCCIEREQSVGDYVWNETEGCLRIPN